MLLRMALGFLVLTVVAAVFGFFGLAAASEGIAKTLFFVFLVGFLITFVLGLTTGKQARV